MITCPQCGLSYYTENYCSTTAMYYTPIFKSGININPNGNITTHVCTCCECGKNFSYSTRYGQLYEGD